jgi:hypothetical protein
VLPDTPASRAGLRPGDRIDLSGVAPLTVNMITAGFVSSPGRAVTIGVSRGGAFHNVTLRAVPESTVPFFIVLRILVYMVPVIIGLLLVLLRPSAITWGFFLFALGAAGTPPGSVFGSRFLNGWTQAAIWNDCVGVLRDTLPRAGLMLFVFALAHRRFTFWPIAAICATALVGFVSAVPALLDPAGKSLGVPSINSSVQIFTACMAVCGIVYAYAHVASRLRQRLNWIAVGFVLWLAVGILDSFLWPTYESYAVHTALDATQIIFPLLVAYAIFRERVVDINFVISRTLVYGMLTAAIVGVFALIDLFLSRSMESRFSLPVDVLVALALGFFFHAMHRKLDDAVDRILFRKRHIADVRLARAAKAIVHVDDRSAVSNYLTDLPVEVLDLTGSALYMRNSGDFSLERCAGWQHQPAARLSASDALVTFLSSELETVRVRDVPMQAAPRDRHDTPVVAIPLVFRSELAGFVLYGAHEDGADLDGEEERALLPLVKNAAVTYDHIEAQALREENRTLRLIPSS